eukprot:jgi/Orpsp1_1/1187524/evm.model.d7180000058358.1
MKYIENNAIYSALYLTKHFPIAQTVLYCNEDTSEEEILSFVYRTIRCEYPVLFLLIKPESLKTEYKKLLIELFTETFSSKDIQEMRSCLLFIYSKENETTEINIEIQKFLDHKAFYLSEDDKCMTKIQNITVYSSDRAGLGKSTMIKKDFEQEALEDPHFKYIYFPIGGDIKKDEIISRLLNITEENVALHLDLLETSKIELVKEFLFSFLILRYYSQNENIFYYGENIKIKVEIPNGFINYKKAYSIFEFFEERHIESHKLPSLEISESDVLSDVQIVCNYIRHEDIIDNKDLYFPKLNMNTKNSVMARPMKKKQCLDIILNEIGSKNFNFYKYKIFVSILSEQLRRFSNSIYFNIDLLNGVKTIRKNLEHTRSYIIRSLVDTVCYFINSFNDTIFEEQNLTYNHDKKDFNYEIALAKANKYLANRKPFTINNINRGMIFFNEDGESITMLPTCQPGSMDYNILKAIYNSNTLDKNIKDIINYENLSTDQYLTEARKILNINKPLDKIKLLDCIKSYVFTKDNFIKLILISLRLRTNIPVILMGETGCGKTSLIRIIAELKGATMHIINIHSGIEDNDIVERLKQFNLFDNGSTSEEDNNQDVWVFMDEFNTSNSLGLITEIMLKHTCKGMKIKKNVKFIGACNPYRLNTQNNLMVGLLNKERHSSRELIYTVNPLPNCLTNYVFDFGMPKDEDIEKYILNMVSQIVLDLNKKERISSDIERLAVKSILIAHLYIKSNFEISSVSLREIRRWGILFEWFIGFLKKDYISRKLGLNYNENSEIFYIYALNLSIYLCYYIRIFVKEKRNEFLTLMKRQDTFGQGFNFEACPKRVQNLIADEVKLEKGIARNKLLLENLFSIFVCINTKIPLYIVGKPGC